MDDILVSVLCLTYNHEEFIRDALDGFVSQKTDFKFEVLIHDDASTDKTQETIREYEEKYPDIIKPIYQTENQYSKGIKISRTYQYPRAKGKFIALCEGDDYWIDPYKLQKQVDYMREHPECSLCVTAVKYIDYAREREYEQHLYGHSTEVSTEEVIKGGGGLFATASMLFCRESYTTMPDVYQCKGIGDYPLCIYFSTVGTVYYMDETCVAYRFCHSGSWTARNATDAKTARINCDNICNMLKNIDEYTDKKYTQVINGHIEKLELSALIMERNYNEVKKYRKTKAYREKPKIIRFKLFLKMYFPFLLKIKHLFSPEK